MGGLAKADGSEAAPPPFVVAVVHRTQGVLGTGVSIARGLVLTNHHVVVSQRPDFIPYSSRDLMIVSGHATRHSILEIHSPILKVPDPAGALDYAFLEIDGDPIQVATPSTSVVYPLSLVGWDEIVFKTTRSSTAKMMTDWLIHCNATQRGISGGPLLNASGDLIALHKGEIGTNEIKCPGGIAAISIPIPRIFETVGTNIPSVVPILKERLGVSETSH